MSPRRLLARAAVPALVATALATALVTALVTAPPTSAAAEPAPGAAGAAGAAGATAWVLTGLERSPEGLLVTARAVRHGSAAPATGHWLQLPGVGWCRQVHVLDPSTSAAGLGAPDRAGSGCAATTDGSLDDGGSATVTAVVADPGGQRLDVVVDDVLVATGVPVTGSAAPSSPDTDGVWTLHPRSTQPRPRFTRAGAAVTGQAVDLSTDVLFAVDSDVLGPDAGAAIEVAAQQLRAQPSRTVAVTGHTDSQGGTAYNLGLSQRRAEAVRAALAAQLGAGWTLDASGVGESEPVADESRPSGVSGAEADAAVAEAQRLDRRVAVVPG